MNRTERDKPFNMGVLGQLLNSHALFSAVATPSSVPSGPLHYTALESLDSKVNIQEWKSKTGFDGFEANLMEGIGKN